MVGAAEAAEDLPADSAPLEVVEQADPVAEDPVADDPIAEPTDVGDAVDEPGDPTGPAEEPGTATDVADPPQEPGGAIAAADPAGPADEPNVDEPSVDEPSVDEPSVQMQQESPTTPISFPSPNRSFLSSLFARSMRRPQPRSSRPTAARSST